MGPKPTLPNSGDLYRSRLDQILDPRELAECLLGLEPADGPVVDADQRGACGVEHRGQRLETAGGRRQAIREWRELAKTARIIVVEAQRSCGCARRAHRTTPTLTGRAP